LYFAFSVGISIEVHQCNDANGIQDILKERIVLKEDACKASDQHACCSAEKESACCAESEGMDDCCVDEHLLIHLDEEQLISKNQVLTFFASEATILPSDNYLLLKEASPLEDHYAQPPPINDDRHIRFCSLTFYG
jgi:hypothetical protein